MKNLLIIFSVCVTLTGCTRMTIPVNIMPFLLIQDNQMKRANEVEPPEYAQHIALNQPYSRLPQVEMLPVDPFQENGDSAELSKHADVIK